MIKLITIFLIYVPLPRQTNINRITKLRKCFQQGNKINFFDFKLLKLKFSGAYIKSKCNRKYLLKFLPARKSCILKRFPMTTNRQHDCMISVAKLQELKI